MLSKFASFLCFMLLVTIPLIASTSGNPDGAAKSSVIQSRNDVGSLAPPIAYTVGINVLSIICVREDGSRYVIFDCKESTYIVCAETYSDKIIIDPDGCGAGRLEFPFLYSGPTLIGSWQDPDGSNIHQYEACVGN